MARAPGGSTARDAAGRVEYRPALAQDEAAIAAIDTSFTTDTVVEVAASEDGFTLRAAPVDPPLHKAFPDDGDDEDEDGDDGAAGPARTVVAVEGGELCGFVAASYEPWNRRLTIRDIAVAPGHRGKGVCGALLEHAVDFARECGAAHVWLEVSNVNAPAIRAYRRMGFAFCGLDTSLYDGTASAGEHALFMSRPLR